MKTNKSNKEKSLVQASLDKILVPAHIKAEEAISRDYMSKIDTTDSVEIYVE